MDDYIIDTYAHNHLKIEIWYDIEADNPLDWITPEERRAWYALKKGGHTLPYEITADTNDFESWTELAEAVTGAGGELAGKVYQFVRWYEHGGVAISLRDTETGREWDAGIAGVIFGDTIGDIKSTFVDYAAYVEGEVYGYTMTNPKDGEVVESTSGFYSEDEVRRKANRTAAAFQHPHEAAYAKNARELHS